MADRNQKQKDWETGYVGKVKRLHDILNAMDKYTDDYLATLQTSSTNGDTSTLPSNGGVGPISGGSAFELTKSIISANEGSYTSVAGSDNGHGVSIGKFQWHEGRALALLQKMRSADKSTFDSTLNANGGASILTKMGYSSWDEVKFDTGEVAAVKTVLQIPQFQKIQDDQVDSDLQGYINKAQDSGLTDAKAIAYFADLYNQSPARAMDIAEVAMRNGGTLDAIHKAALANEVMGKYATRRNNTYQKLLAAVVSDTSNVNSSQTTIGEIAIATIKNGIVYPPDGNRRTITKAMYQARLKWSAGQYASLDTSKFSFPNGDHSNMFWPHFATIMNLVHAKAAPLMGVDKLIISSGLRTEIIDVEKQMNMNEASISPHMAGFACDIFIRGGGDLRFTLADAAWGLGIRGIGIGADHVHIDAAPFATWKEHDETHIYKGPGKWVKA